MAILGMIVEKSGVEPSDRIGVKLRFLQTWTQFLSNVWPEVTMTGSAIRELEMEHMNSDGGVC